MLRFLLAQLHLGSLINKTTPRAIRRTLEKLPKGSDALDKAYHEAMERIQDQEIGFQGLAKRVLSWIICAKRPLTTLELRHALTVEAGDSELGEDNLQEIEEIVLMCAGLVTVDEESNIIRLVHYTTQAYFEQTQIYWFPNAQKDITTVCVIYLSFDAFTVGFCKTDAEFEARLRLNPLYDYAARNCGYHACTASTEVEQLIIRFLQDEAKVSASVQAMIAEKSVYSYGGNAPGRITGLHLAAFFRLSEVMMALIKNGNHPDRKDFSGQTPLIWAPRNGHEAVVKMLLADNMVDPDTKDTECGRTPLSWAAEYGYETVVKLLLANDGVDPNSRDAISGHTPLSLAARSGNEAVVELLLAKDGIDPDSKDNSGRTSLFLAAHNGQEAVVKLLLANNRVNPDTKDTKVDRTPLSFAAEKGHEAIAC